MAPQVAVVGPPGVGKRSLIQRLLTTGPSEAVSAVDVAPGSAVAAHGWRLETKYYTAAVQLCSWRLGPDGDAAETVLRDVGSCEALVLVFDASSEGSFAALKAFVVTAGETLDTPVIRLCIANRMDAAQDPSGLLARANEWCLEGGFELIRTAAGVPEADARLAAPSSDGVGGAADPPDGGDGACDDPQGVPRVREALEAHLWPGHELKATPARGGTLAKATRPDVEPTARVTHGAAPPPQTSDAPEDASAAAGVESFESLLAEMAHLRAAVCDAPGGLSDEVRRDRAATLAQRMLASMFDGEDDGEGGSSADEHA